MTRGAMGLFAADLLILPTGFLTAVYLSRSLGPASYGLFALVSRLVLWIEWGILSGFSDTTLRFVAETDDWKSVGVAAVRLHLFFGLASGLLVWTAAPLLASLFAEPTLAGLIRLFSIEIPIHAVFRAYLTIMTGRERYAEHARISAFRWTARLALIVGFVAGGFSVAGAIAGSIAACGLGLVVCLHRVRLPVWRGKSLPVAALLGFAKPLYLSNLSLRIFRLDLFALKALGATAAQAGFYGAALNLSMPPALLSKSLASPLLATLGRTLANEQTADSRSIAVASLRSIFWLAPFAAMVAGSAGEIAALVYGAPFLPAGRLLSWLILAAIGLHGIHISNAVLVAHNRPWWTFFLAGPMIPIALAGHLLLIPWIGGEGAAIVTTATALTGMLAGLLALDRIASIRVSAKTVLSGSGCSVLVFYAATVWTAPGWMVLGKICALSVSVLLLFVLSGELSRAELQFFRSLLSPEKGKGPRGGG
jgi:O-antigen/teichoic acid export membrane protein